MKTHFATVEPGNESNSSDDWSAPICSTETSSDIYLSNEWITVDCKKCLELRIQYESEMKQAMEHSCKDMGNFVKFVERKNGVK